MYYADSLALTQESSSIKAYNRAYDKRVFSKESTNAVEY